MTDIPSSAGRAADGAGRMVRRHHLVRASGFAYSFLVLAVHGWERGFGAWFWIALAFSFLVYPHLLRIRALRSRDPRQAEHQNILFVDPVVFGVWTAALHFPTWVAYGSLSAVMLNAIIARGVEGTLVAFGIYAASAAFWVAAFGYQYWPETSTLVTTLCFFGSLGYTCAVGFVVYRQNRRIVRGREELRASEERYRLITENAGDLVAMVDQDGRWLYASPSYARLLPPADLEIGTDAFRSVHPDDADQARVAVLRVAGTGKPRDLSLRLVDKDGRVRQYKTRAQPLAPDGVPGNSVILVSQDVTDLRESEERLLLAGHALEGMTEAIIITGADGTVHTVNRAFCEITGYEREEVVGQPEKALRSGLQPPEFYDEIYATVQRDGLWSGTQWGRRKNGSIYREWRSIRVVRDPAGATTHYVIVFFEADSPGQRSGTAGRSV